MRLLAFTLLAATAVPCLADLPSVAPPVQFSERSVHSGKWSDPATWSGRRVPAAGDRVQIRAGDHVVYDVNSDQAIRMVHVAGTLTFARDRNTRLDVGLLKIEPGDTATEDGFACDMHTEPPKVDPKAPRPALEIGTTEEPIPAGVTATVRLVYFPGMD